MKGPRAKEIKNSLFLREEEAQVQREKEKGQAAEVKFKGQEGAISPARRAKWLIPKVKEHQAQRI